MSLELRKFRVEDYLDIQRRKFEMLTFLQFPNAREVAQRLAMGPAYTIENSKGVIASGGIVPFWKGVGEAWIVSSESLPDHKFFFIKTVLKKLQDLGRNYDRIQTTIDIENIVSIKWAEWMGFECEGLMRKFIGGRDYWRYALVRSSEMGYAAIPYVMMAVAVAGTAVSVYSAQQQGDAAKEAKDREAAQLASSAAQARLAAKQKAEDTKKEHERILATQRAKYAASGFEMSGSPLLVQMESMKESEEELRRIIETGELGYSTQMESSSEASTQGKQAATSGYVNAAGQLVQGTRTIDKIGRDYNWWGTT